MSTQIVVFLIHAIGHPSVLIVEHHVYEELLREIIRDGGETPPLVSEVKVMNTLVLSRAGKFQPADFN